jgi:hypothetical protein
MRRKKIIIINIFYIYRPGQILFQKEFYFQIVNQKISEKISNLAQKLFDEFYKQNKYLINIYVFSFLILVIDLTSLLISLNSAGIFKDKINGFNSWVLVLPVLIEWFITLGFYISFRYRLKKLKKKIKKLITDKKNMLKCYNEENSKLLFKSLKLQGRHFKNSKFKNLLKSILLCLFPIVIKTAIFKNVSFKDIFAVSASLFYGYNYIFDLIKLIIKKRKQCLYMNKLLKITNGYKSINNSETRNVEQDNNISLDDIEIYMNDNAIYERNSKMKSILGEHYLNISFMVIKCILGILFIIYFNNIGEKLDGKNNSCSWIILFIPFYICIVPSLIFCILHILSLYSIFKGNIWKVIVTIFPCLISFIANCVIIPLKLENRISMNSSFITIFFVIGTIFFFLHLLVLNKKI